MLFKVPTNRIRYGDFIKLTFKEKRRFNTGGNFMFVRSCKEISEWSCRIETEIGDISHPIKTNRIVLRFKPCEMMRILQSEDTLEKRLRRFAVSVEIFKEGGEIDEEGYIIPYVKTNYMIRKERSLLKIKQ